MTTMLPAAEAIQHPGEDRSNSIRRQAAEIEPKCLRTITSSQTVIARSAGCYHWTPEGKKLLDFSSGVLVANLGHNPTRWWKRVFQLMGWEALPPGNPEGISPAAFTSMVPLTAYNAITPLEVSASQRLVANMRSQPGGNRCEQVLWAASGSEAIQKALWAALDRRPGENLILATRHGFHGKKGLANAVTGSEQDPERDARVKFLPFPQEECGTLDARTQTLNLQAYQEALDKLWDEHGSQICCLITEPYLGAAGSFHPQPEYLQLLEKFCREHDLIFILDEVQANFGRTGEMYAFTAYGLEPDLVVLGKGLANGIPVAAVVGRADLFAPMKYGEGSDTWSANPLSMAAVMATLEEFETTDVLIQARELGKVLENGLRRLQNGTEIVKRVRGEVGVWGLECAPLGSHSAAEVALACVAACYHGDSMGRAIHFLGPLAGKVLRVSPPLVLPLDEARVYLDALYHLLTGVQARLQAS